MNAIYTLPVTKIGKRAQCIQDKITTLFLPVTKGITIAPCIQNRNTTIIGSTRTTGHLRIG